MVCFSQSTATVAAWNLAGFGGISPERLARQVEGLTLLDAEVVALVEISPVNAIETLRQGLEEKGVIYKASIIPQEGDLHIGVLYKNGIIATDAQFIEGSDLGDRNKRKSFVVTLEIGKFDFLLIVAHLKAGRGRGDQKIRDRQAKVIGQFIKDRRSESREDILLVGDFNMIPGQDISNFHHLGGDDLMDFISSWDLQSRSSHIMEAGRANLLDGFAISRTYSTEYIRGSLRVFPMHWSLDMGRERFRESISDHLPFIAKFRIDRSRD